MTIRISILCVAILLALQSKAMDASLSYATFNAQGQPFVEVYLHIIGQSVAFAQADVINNQASVEVIILFKKGEEIVKFDKYNLQSPLTETVVNFVDQKRYAVPNGDYSIEVVLTDLNQTGNVKEWKQDISLNFSSDKLEQSDIQL